MSPTQSEMRVIDTRRNTRPGGPVSHESVRKYICESCALEMGGAMGMVTAEEADDLRESAVDWQNQAIRFAQRLEEVESNQVRVVPMQELTDGFIEHVKAEVAQLIRDELATKVKPTPRKRAAASDE